ncbi:MAG: DUF1670 domain-containing protein [Candidatus Latescibacteria bacterium]|nr:DUF1670 domain-containing protein [Candidatus Latescibacterota bacterium]
MDKQAIERLTAKSPKAAIIQRIAEDFRLAPIMARAMFDQIDQYYRQYFPELPDPGQMTFLAVSADVPPGRAVVSSQRVPVHLTMDTKEDVGRLAEGVAVYRRGKLKRLTQEAYAQGALLTHEDLARLLCTSLSTIKRDIQFLQGQGEPIPTRGQMSDIGPGMSHKRQIVQLFLDGYTYTEIEIRTHHTIAAIRRYVDGFTRVARLTAKGLSKSEIRIATGTSERMITEYQKLYRATPADNPQLQHLFTVPDEATAQPATIKRGSWSR